MRLFSNSILSLEIKNRKPPLKFPLQSAFAAKNYNHLQRLHTFGFFQWWKRDHKYTQMRFVTNSTLESRACLQPKSNSGLRLPSLPLEAGNYA